MSNIQVTKRLIPKGSWTVKALICIMEVMNIAEVKHLASTFGDTAVSLDTGAFFFEGIKQEKEIINPSSVVNEIQNYSRPGISRFIGYTIDRKTLRPGEERFLSFYFQKVEPACLGSNEKGEQKALRQKCLKVLFEDKTLLEFIYNVVSG